MRKIIVGSRRSQLALTQSKWVIAQLNALGLPFEFELKEIVTQGDQIQNVMLSKVGGKGLFVKEIEQAMLTKEIDMAIHSMKDMPAELPEGLVIGSVPFREDHRDAFISVGDVPLSDLPAGAIVGTSSLRRSAQLLAFRPDLEIQWIRGNIDTRLEKLRTENYDAIILAAAGLARMGWKDKVVTAVLDESICVPAVGQGALAIECRGNDAELLAALARFTCQKTLLAVKAERVYLSQMEGGCQVPIAGYAEVDEVGNITLTALVATPDGKQVYKEIVTGDDPIEVGHRAAELMIQCGAKALIKELNDALQK